MGDGSQTPIDASVTGSQPEALPQVAIVPREINGLGEGAGRYGTSAIGKDSISTTVGVSYLGREDKEFDFAIRQREATIRIEQPRTSSSPGLITGIHADNADPNLLQLFERRATEHNTAKAIKFLREGGKVEDLTATPFMPDIAQLQKMAQEAGLAQASEPLEVPAPKSEVPMNPTTVRQLVLYGLSADAVKPGFKPFLTEQYSSITPAQRDEFLTRIRTGQFYRRQYDEMLSLISDPERRKAYADQFDLLKNESGVREDVFENGNDLGDPSLKGPWRRNY